VKSKRQALHVREQVLAQIGDHTLANPHLQARMHRGVELIQQMQNKVARATKDQQLVAIERAQHRQALIAEHVVHEQLERPRLEHTEQHLGRAQREQQRHR
jgi:hypothetical protein